MAESKAWVMIPKLRDSTDDEVNIVLDMRPLVLCKDCKHHRKGTCSAEAGMAFPPQDDWFCADGEKSNENNALKMC